MFISKFAFVFFLTSSLLAVFALAASNSPAGTSGASSCKHKIFFDFSSCKDKNVKTYKPKYSDYFRNYAIDTTTANELCITLDSSDGLFFLSQSRSNEYGTNVYAVEINFETTTTTAKFYLRDEHNVYVDNPAVPFREFSIKDAANQNGRGAVQFKPQEKVPTAVTLNAKNVNVFVKFC